MASYKCVASFRRKTVIFLVSVPKICEEQQSSIVYVFGMAFKGKKRCLEQKTRMTTRQLGKRQFISSMHDF